MSAGEPLGFRTGLEPLDSATGGLPCGKLLVISGEEKSGRTSLLLQLCAIAASEGRRCLLIDPASKLHASRLKSVCEARRADLSMIWISSPQTLREQTRFILKAAELLEEGSVLAVDNLTYLYRVELTGDLSSDRPKFMELALELAALKSAALERGSLSAAVFDVHDVPSAGPFATRPVSENLLRHFADLRVHLTNVIGELKSMAYELGELSGKLTIRTSSSGIEPVPQPPAVF